MTGDRHDPDIYNLHFFTSSQNDCCYTEKTYDLSLVDLLPKELQSLRLMSSHGMASLPTELDSENRISVPLQLVPPGYLLQRSVQRATTYMY